MWQYVFSALSTCQTPPHTLSVDNDNLSGDKHIGLKMFQVSCIALLCLSVVFIGISPSELCMNEKLLINAVYTACVDELRCRGLSHLHEFFDVFLIHLEFGKQTDNLHSDTLTHTQEHTQLNLSQAVYSLKGKRAGVFGSVNSQLCVFLERCVALVTLWCMHTMYM